MYAIKTKNTKMLIMSNVEQKPNELTKGKLINLI